MTNPIKFSKIANVEQDIEAALKSEHVTRSSMDDIWNKIRIIFQYATKKTIPYEDKKVGNIQSEETCKIERRQYRYYNQLKDIKRLRRLLTYARSHEGKQIIPNLIVEYNIFIMKINKKYDCSLEYISTKNLQKHGLERV